MNGLKSLFESFYGLLVLRDFFGKIIPGAVLLLAVVWPHVSWQTILVWMGSFWFAIFALGLSWVTAFAAQSVGEWIPGGLLYYPKKLGGDKTFYDKLNEFDDVARPEHQQKRERFVIIKEACGNMFFCGMLAFAKVGADLLLWRDSEPSPVPSAALVGILLIFLIRMHHVHVARQNQYMVSVVGQSSSRPKKDESRPRRYRITGDLEEKE